MIQVTLGDVVHCLFLIPAEWSPKLGYSHAGLSRHKPRDRNVINTLNL